MAFVWHTVALLTMASGALMAALGGALLLANPRKDWNRVFALLAVFWGAQIVSVNVVRVTDDAALARLAGEVSLAFLIPLYFFIVAFAAIFPRPLPRWQNGAPFAALALPGALCLVLLFAAPTKLIAQVGRVTEGDLAGTFTLTWGAFFPYLVVAPLYGGLVFALFTMMRRLEEPASVIERKQVTFVLAALALFVAHATPLQLHKFGDAALGGVPATEASTAEAAVIALIMLGGFVLTLVLAARLVARARARVAPGHRQEARIVLAAIGAGLLTALAVEVARLWMPAFELLGVVRSGSVAIIVYGIVRYQLFDIDVRVKHGATAGAALLAGAGLAAAAYALLQGAAAPPAAGAVALVVAAAAFLPALRMAYRLADRLAPGVSADGEHLYLRKLEVYRASVEAALREGKQPGADDADLREQRRKLGLSERDHGIVVSLAATRAEPQGATPDLRPGAVAFGKYEIASLLAEGGFGRVFLARDKVLGRQVVIKELLAKWRGTPSVVRTFLREAQIAGQLNHPNIVAIHEVEQRGADYYVVMEYLPGGTLAERLRDGSLSQREAVRVALAVLEGLAAAHARGVVHRDVKPDNILFGARGEVKLADFGIATLAEEDPQRTISGLTTARFQPGTLQYMSPEQARGLPVDARSDLYAVGAVLHRMLTGKPHLDIAGLDELSARNALAAPPAAPVLPRAPEALNAALQRALAKEPEQRFATARAFADALAAVSPPPPSRPEPA
ncbi:MAG TPA: serine/threonine-protein kinase [Candidatus Thermoplasmatota archaeon]|nr:serine/threonine-protein kinase [Candidatus Thermoplasmatota archaeon]